MVGPDVGSRRLEPSRRPPRWERRAPWALALLALVLRLATAARWPTEWDSVQLTLGLDRFDVTEGSPHAPGYWLYVAAGRLVRAVTPLDGIQSLTVLAALASAATVGLAVVVGRELGGRWLGLAAGATLLASPFLWFYGSTVDTYVFDALASVVLLLLAWRARPGGRHGVAAAAVTGVAAGLRQTSLLVLGPLALVAVLRSVRSARQAVAAAVAGLGAVALWLVPMVLEQPGGWSSLQATNRRTWREAAAQASFVAGAPARAVLDNLAQATGHALVALLLVLPATAVAGALWLSGRRGGGPVRRHGPLTPPRLLAVALVPPFAFTVVVFFGKAGYVLSYLPAAVLLALWPATRLDSRGRAAVGVLVALGVALSAQRFVLGEGILPTRTLDRAPWFTHREHGAPYRLTRLELRRVDRETEAYRELAGAFDPTRDVLVYAFLNGHHRYRHAMLTLPEFTIHHVRDGEDQDVGYGFRWWHEYDHRLEVPPGGRAVWVLDVRTPELQALLDSGTAEAVTLPTGPTVYVTGPGASLYGVVVEETAGAIGDPPRDS